VSSLLHWRADRIESFAIQLKVSPHNVLERHPEVVLQQIVTVVGVLGDDHQTLDDQHQLGREEERERGCQVAE
jgi:hypothetical protein